MGLVPICHKELHLTCGHKDAKFRSNAYFKKKKKPIRTNEIEY